MLLLVMVVMVIARHVVLYAPQTRFWAQGGGRRPDETGRAKRCRRRGRRGHRRRRTPTSGRSHAPVAARLAVTTAFVVRERLVVQVQVDDARVQFVRTVVRELFEVVGRRGPLLFAAREAGQRTAHAVVRVYADVRGRGGRVTGGRGDRVHGRRIRVDKRGRGSYGHCRRGGKPVGWRLLRHGQRHGREAQARARPQSQRHVAPGLRRRGRRATGTVQQLHRAGHHERTAEPHARLQHIGQRIISTLVDAGPRWLAAVVAVTVVIGGPGLGAHRVPRGCGRGRTSWHHFGPHARHVHLGAGRGAQPLVQRVPGQIHDAERVAGSVTTVAAATAFVGVRAVWVVVGRRGYHVAQRRLHARHAPAVRGRSRRRRVVFFVRYLRRGPFARPVPDHVIVIAVVVGPWPRRRP